MMKRSQLQLRRGLCAALSVALLIAQPISATAQEQPAKKAPAKTVKGKNVMTRDELRVCLNEQDRLQQISGRIKSEQSELDRQKAEVERIDAELASKVGTVDPNDTTTLDALKAQGAKRDALADAYNARLNGLREQSASYDSGRKNWIERCGNRDYDEMDEAAIRLEQKRAAAAASKKK
jgi:hypothetical protein